MFYIILIIGLLLSLVPEKKHTTRFFAAILIITAALRYGTGQDYFNYGIAYRKVLPNPFLEISNPLSTHEIGYRMLESVIKSSGASYQVFLVVAAIISIYFIYKISMKYSSNPTLSLVVYYTCYYFVWTYSSLRQGLAMSIGLYYLLDAVYGNKTIKILIITVLLSLLHSSALIFAVLYAASKINFSKRQIIAVTVMAIIISLLPLSNIMRTLAKEIDIFKRILPYLNANYSIRSVLDFKTIARLAFMMLVFVFYDSYAESSPENKKILNMYLISFAIYFVFKFAELTAARLAVYGKMLDILILTNIICVIKSKWNKGLYITCLVLLMTAYMYKDLSVMGISCGIIEQGELNIPYVNIFNKENYITDLIK